MYLTGIVIKIIPLRWLTLYSFFVLVLIVFSFKNCFVFIPMLELIFKNLKSESIANNNDNNKNYDDNNNNNP